jgi:hypothetical protein
MWTSEADRRSWTDDFRTGEYQRWVSGRLDRQCLGQLFERHLALHRDDFAVVRQQGAGFDALQAQPADPDGRVDG